MKGITTIASLPGSGSGCQSALPAEKSKGKATPAAVEPGPDMTCRNFIQFWLLGDGRETRIADQTAIARRIAIAHRKARNA